MTLTAAQDVLQIDAPLTEDVICGCIADAVRKVGCDSVVVGLSGGLDSALAAAFACHALGPENVIPVIMPYKTSHPGSKSDAMEVCTAFQITPVVVEISTQIDDYFSAFPDANSVRRGNKMSRERMSILYDLSMAHGALVLGTSNKTELLLGYGTLFGDMASAVNPLGDLYKTQVRSLAHHIGVPHSVIDKQPSADLWEGQTDEGELGFTYEAVDHLLFHLVDERRSTPDLVAMGFDAAFVATVKERVRSTQYKRRPPVIAKVSNRTIDREFRYPRDWGH